MKYIITMSLVLLSSLNASQWNYSSLITQGYSVELKCEHGILMEVVTKGDTVIKDIKCYEYSFWLNACTTQPIKCTKDK